MHGGEVVQASRGQELAPATEARGGLGGVGQDVVPGQVGEVDPGDLAQVPLDRVRAELGTLVLGQGPQGQQVGLPVQAQGVVDGVVQVRGNLGHAGEGAGTHQVGGTVARGQAPGQAELTVQEGVLQGAAVDLGVDQLPAGAVERRPRLELEGRGVGVGADNAEGDVGGAGTRGLCRRAAGGEAAGGGRSTSGRGTSGRTVGGRAAGGDALGRRCASRSGGGALGGSGLGGGLRQDPGGDGAVAHDVAATGQPRPPGPGLADGGQADGLQAGGDLGGGVVGGGGGGHEGRQGVGVGVRAGQGWHRQGGGEGGLRHRCSLPHDQLCLPSGTYLSHAGRTLVVCDVP